MGVSLSLTVSESSVSQANNTSVVKAVLKAKTSSTTYNHTSPYGYITIDGTKYTFNHSFDAGTTTTLATKSKTVTHNADGSKSVTVKGYLQSGVSSGNISTSKTVTLTKIARQFTVAYNANGGSGAPASQTKTYGTTLTLSSTKPTRGGYVFKGWATSASGSVAYASGGSYTSNAAATLYAVWEAVNYDISFDANGGEGAPGDVVKPHNTTISLPVVVPVRNHYSFVGWSTVKGGEAEYVAGASYTGNADATLYAVWQYVYTPPTIKIVSAFRTNSSTSTSEVPTGTYVFVRVDWTTDEDWGPPVIIAKCNGSSMSTEMLTGSSGSMVCRYTGLSKNTTGNIEVTIRDRSSQDNNTASAAATIGKSIVPFRLKPDAAEFGAGAWFSGDVRIGGDGFHDAGSVALLDFIYPIGSIYMTADPDFNPNMWTGESTWEKVEGRFLLGSSTEYEVGAEGGEATHKLTVSEMPSHTHVQNQHRHALESMFSGGSGGSYSRYVTSSSRTNTTKYSAYTTPTNQNTGGDGAHNNMPPYEVVNIWKRIA